MLEDNDKIVKILPPCQMQSYMKQQSVQKLKKALGALLEMLQILFGRMHRKS